MYLNTEKKLEISQKKHSAKAHKNVAKGLLLREIGFKTGVVPKHFQAIAEDNLVTKNYEELRCRLPGVPRSTFLMVFSPDGKKVASTHGNHNVYVTDLTTGKNVNVLMGHPRTPWCIAFHPSSNQILASGCLGGQVRVWDLHGGSEVWTSHGQSVIASLAFHPTDRLLVIATYNELHFWDWSQPKPFAKCYTNNEKEKVRYVAFDPLGLKLVTGISNAPPLVSQWDRVGPAPMQAGPGTSQTLQGASSMHQPMAQRPPSAVPPPTSETERRISVCYRSLVEQYDQLVQRYFDLMRPRSIPTTDRGTDPMDLESETGGRNVEGSESSNASGASRRISDGWRTSSRNSSRTGRQSVYNEVLRIARRRSASTTTTPTPTSPTTTSNTTTAASGPSFLNQESHSTRSSDSGQDVRAYCLRRTCARVGEQARTFTPENPLRITASQSSAFRPRAPRTGEAEGANRSSSTTSNSHDRSQQGRAERFSNLSSENVGSRTPINRNRPFPDLGIRFGIQLLSRHIDNMQQLCRARLEILQLQQIRRVWEDLQRQIRSLHVAVRESGSSTTESASRNDESGSHIPNVSQMMEQLARISDSEPGSGRKRAFRNGPSTVLNNFANKRKSKGTATEPSTSNSIGNVKNPADIASSDDVISCNPSTSQEQDIAEQPVTGASTDISIQTIETETKDNTKHSNLSVSATESEQSNMGTGINLNSNNFTSLNCSTNRESSSKQSADSKKFNNMNIEDGTSSNITESSKISNAKKSDKKLNSKTGNDLKNVTEDYSDNLSAKNSSSNIGFHSRTLNDQTGQASTSQTSVSNDDSTQNNASITSGFRRFRQNQRSCASVYRLNKIPPPTSANQIRRPWFLQSLARSLRSCPRLISSRLQGRSNCDNIEMSCDRSSQTSIVNKRVKRKKKKSKSSDSARDSVRDRPGCSSNASKSEKSTSSKEVKLNIEGNNMDTSVSSGNDFSNSNFGPSTSTATEQSKPRPDASSEPPFKIRKQNLKRETDSSASRGGTSSSSQPSCQRRHGAQGGHSASSTCQCSTCNQESIWQIIHRLQELVQQQRERGSTTRSIPNSRSYRHSSSGISRRLEAWRFRERSSWVSHQTGSDSDSNPESERRAPWPWERRTSADRLTTALQNELYEVERLQELSSNLNYNSVNQSELVGRGNPRYRARQVLTLMVDSLTQFFEENDMSERTSSGALDERVYNLYTLLQLALELTDLLLAQLFSTRRELESQWVNRLRSPVALDVSDNQQTHSSRDRRPWASNSYRLSLSNRRGVRHRQEGNPIGCPSSTEATPTRGRGWPRSRLVGWYSRPLPVAHTTPRSTSRLRLGRVAANRSLGRMTTPRRFTVPDPPSDYSTNEGGGEPRVVMVSGHGPSVRVAVPSPVRSPSPPRETWSYHGRVVYRAPEAQPSNPPSSDTFTVPTVQVNDVTVPESALNMQVPPPPRAHSPPPDVWNVIGPHQFQPPSGWVLRLGDVYFSEPPRPQSPPPFPTSAYFPRGFTVSVNRTHQPGWRSQLLTPRAPLYDHEEILAMHADSLIRGGDAVIITDAPLSPNHRIQVWDFSSYKIPDISNAEKNLIVSECKIHNDASVDVSKDGKLLVTLLPAARICVTTMLGVYSLQWESLGQCLYTTSFEQNAVSVSLSPACRHLLVGLASRRIVLPNDRLTVAQIFKLEGGEPGKMVGGRGRLCHMRDIEQSREHSYSSLNCIRWAPAPGQGLVYGTNVGQLRVLR